MPILQLLSSKLILCIGLSQVGRAISDMKKDPAWISELQCHCCSNSEYFDPGYSTLAHASSVPYHGPGTLMSCFQKQVWKKPCNDQVEYRMIFLMPCKSVLNGRNKSCILYFVKWEIGAMVSCKLRRIKELLQMIQNVACLLGLKLDQLKW